MLKWFFALVLTVSAIVGNHIYQAEPFIYRASALALASILVLWSFFATTQGKNAKSFLKESRQELRKVVWSPRREVVQTTFMVIVLVIVVGLFLFFIDGLISKVIKWFTVGG